MQTRHDFYKYRKYNEVRYANAFMIMTTIVNTSTFFKNTTGTH
jgi:hypothetical protein